MPSSNPPNPKHFFILGAAKCGTTSMYYYLNQHPEIYMSIPKEPLFFEKEYEKGIEYYWETYFSGWRMERFVGEARHRNLYLPYIAPRIKASFPDAKLLIMVRNPVDRAYSHYLHRKNRGIETLSFDEAIRLDLDRIERREFVETEKDIEHYIEHLAPSGMNLYYRTYLDSGYYAEQIERYLEYFDKKQLLVIFIDDLKRDPERVISNVVKFLDEKLSPPLKIELSIQNKRTNTIYRKIISHKSRIPGISKFLELGVSKNIKSLLKETTGYFEYRLLAREKMSAETRSWLVAHYKEHNRRLEELTGRNLSSWN